MPHPTGLITLQELRRAARTAIGILKDHNMPCCLFGSLACHVYGMKYRVPNDVDLVVLNNRGNDAEDIKQILVGEDDRFFLAESINPDADYQVLYFAPYYDRSRTCKVDILTTGKTTKLEIPKVPSEYVHFVHPFNKDDNSLPVMPLLALLLMKLRGWTDHRHSDLGYMQRKVPQDVEDIDALMEIALKEEVRLDDEDEGWMPRWFVDDSKDRVEEYLRKFPQKADDWEALGF